MQLNRFFFHSGRLRIVNFLWIIVFCTSFSNKSILFAQAKYPVKKKLIQLSIVPGFGTNGLNPGNFDNSISLNLISGYSHSTLLFELGIASNLNTYRTQGLQIGGLINITGANLYQGLSEKEKLESINRGAVGTLTGLQFSGISNIVLGEGNGGQVSGGINLVKEAMVGLQVSGVANVVHKYSFGVQISGLFNVSTLAFSGVQIAGIANYTQGDLAGFQTAVLNHCGDIYGKNSYNNTQFTGLQLGLINIAKKMNGFQFGLINYAFNSQGIQVGLINIYKGGKQTDTKDGTAIGLLNFGDLTYGSVYVNEIFGLNYEISTGNRQNKRILLDRRNKYFTNALIFSHKSFNDSKWGIGYGLKKMFFNRSEVPGMTESNFYAFGLDLQHISNEVGKFDRNLSLLTRFKIMAGKRVLPKTFGFNWFAALSLNAYFTDAESSMDTNFLSNSKKINDVSIDYWPGLTVGLLLH